MNNIEIYKKFKQKALSILQSIQLIPESRYFINSHYMSDPQFVRSMPQITNLSNVWEKVQNDKYNYPDEFKNDVNQIFSCAKIFYKDPQNAIHKAANKLQKEFNIQSAKLPHILTQDEVNSIDQRYIELRILRYQLNKTTHV